VVRAQRTDAVQLVRTLPDLAPVPGLESIVPALPHLTNLELRVVQAAARPLAPWLPALVERGQTITFLPLDARPADLAPTHGAGVVRVESLFDLREQGWAFATELARLVEGAHPELRALAAHYGRWLTRRSGLPVSSGPDGLEGLDAWLRPSS
jgi:hypothetical protein